jgi:cytochrome c553
MDKRLDPVMNAITKGLTDVDIANLAAYYASLK